MSRSPKSNVYLFRVGSIPFILPNVSYSFAVCYSIFPFDPEDMVSHVLPFRCRCMDFESKVVPVWETLLRTGLLEDISLAKITQLSMFSAHNPTHADADKFDLMLR